MRAVLERSAFSTSRLLEFFSTRELSMQIGHVKRAWPIAILKELIDNSLDACEGDIHCPRPVVAIGIEEDAFSVVDNGPGIPESTIKGALDYSIRVSDKAGYVSPTRGQLGNALMCVWAAPFVASDERKATIEVRSHGVLNEITVDVDRIGQSPSISHAKSPASVQKGTSFKVHWPNIASSLQERDMLVLYHAEDLVFAYSIMNPHAEFWLMDHRGTRRIEPSCPDWRKWRTNNPTSSHWYDESSFCNLVAAHVKAQRDGGKPKTVRQFVAEFDGLSRTQTRAAVLSASALTGTSLSDLTAGSEVDREKASALLKAMTDATKPVDPKRLGIIGKSHIVESLLSLGCDESCTKYRQSKGMVGDVPFVLEMALGADLEAADNHTYDHRRRVIVGLNWSPAINTPIDGIYNLFTEMRIEASDPVTVFIHLAYPLMQFKDRGKARLDLPPEIQKELEDGIRTIAAKWKKIKIKADRDDRLSRRQIEQEMKAKRLGKMRIKDAAFKVMERAYMHASGNNTGPANARQIMYAARPLVMELTGGKIWSSDNYFVGTLLPQFALTNPDVTANWDVIYDARGHFVEPHTHRTIDLGTLGVRRYVSGWSSAYTGAGAASRVDFIYGTHGPENRYNFVLYIEKEGFMPLLERAKISERFDIAIMSTKGISNISSRHLVDKLSLRGATVLVLHDFDKAGFTIASTIQSDCMRHKFESQPHVIDIGLRLEDAERIGLQGEPVFYKKCKKNPKINLAQSGATEREQAYLVAERCGASGYKGQRIELNAMTSPQFIEFVEGKLAEAGVQKVVPDNGVLESALRSELRRKFINDKIEEIAKEAETAASSAVVPADLRDRVSSYLNKSPTSSWDDAISNIAINI